MSRSSFEHGLHQLQDEVLALGKMVNKALQQATEALKQRNLSLAKYVIENDKEINRQRFAIEENALTLIATQQPVVAHDLRWVASVLHIAGELERMGDHAKGIARIAEQLEGQSLVKPLVHLPPMSEKCQKMLEEVLQAFLRQDADAAQALAKEDDEIDSHYDQIYQELLAIMLADPRTINGATYLIWAAHNLERFGDRITNICERIIFVATGEMIEISGQSQKDRKQSALPSASQELEG